MDITIKKVPKIIKKDLNDQISANLKSYYETEEGKENKRLAHVKRSVTMEKQKTDARSTVLLDGKKQCKGKCQKVLDLSEFRLKKDSLDGLQPWCNACVKEAKADWRAKNIAKCTTFTCSQCPKTYKLKDSLTRHIKEKHSSTILTRS